MTDGRDTTVVRVNLARGLCSLLDQGALRIALKVPSVGVHAHVLADMLKQRLCEIAVLNREVRPLDLAREVGLVEPEKPKRKRRRRA